MQILVQRSKYLLNRGQSKSNHWFDWTKKILCSRIYWAVGLVIEIDQTLHLHSLHFDAPGVCSLVQRSLHGPRDALPVTENLVEILCAEDGPEGGLCQQLGAVVSVLHVCHADSGVTDPVVDHRVHRHRYAVLGENGFETESPCIGLPWWGPLVAPHQRPGSSGQWQSACQCRGVWSEAPGTWHGGITAEYSSIFCWCQVKEFLVFSRYFKQELRLLYQDKNLKFENHPPVPGAALVEPAQPEDDGPLVLLHHLEADTQRPRQRDQDQQPGREDQQPATDTKTSKI